MQSLLITQWTNAGQVSSTSDLLQLSGVSGNREADIPAVRQICIAPDFALCDTPETETKLVEAIKTVIAEFEGDKGPAIEGPDYTSIINKTHYKRISGLIDSTKGKIVINGGRNEAKLKIGTVIVIDVKEDDVLMEGQFTVEGDDLYWAAFGD